MSDDIFSGLDTQKDNPIHIALSNALETLVNALIDEKNTNISKRELKSVSILKQNPYIWNIIKDYVPNKRYVKSAFGKDIQQAISKISNAIGQVESDKEKDGFLTRQFNRFR
ncbi:MAG: hypothetical protein E3J52_05835 [Promethearchaeota archaeon]|nr:MAG: hypothetical protein E3J52_05835 [Candidatus Lokiarchaeota archaeon]